jgi:hypothetical protein
LEAKRNDSLSLLHIKGNIKIAEIWKGKISLGSSKIA